jgi:hypothetical protein
MFHSTSCSIYRWNYFTLQHSKRVSTFRCLSVKAVHPQSCLHFTGYSVGALTRTCMAEVGSITLCTTFPCLQRQESELNQSCRPILMSASFYCQGQSCSEFWFERQLQNMNKIISCLADSPFPPVCMYIGKSTIIRNAAINLISMLFQIWNVH